MENSCVSLSSKLNAFAGAPSAREAALAKIGGRATAEMQLLNLSLSVEEFCLHVDFLIEVAQVFFHAIRVARHDFVAGAVVAERTTKRDMNVKGQWAAESRC